MKIVLGNLLIYSFSIVLAYLTILFFFPVHWVFKIFVFMLYGYLFYVKSSKAFGFEKVSEVIEKNDAHIIMPFLMIGLSLFSLVVAINILVPLFSFAFYFDDGRFFQDVGNLVNIFNKDEIEFLANSTLLSVVILFITSYYLYKFFVNISILIYMKCLQRYRWARLNSKANNKKMLNTFTVIIVFAGFLPVFIEQIVEHDEIIEKIKSLILGIFLTTLIPYIYLLNKDIQY